MAQSKIKIYTVSEINSLIKGILENNLPSRLTILGEITDFRPHHSGNYYFKLKDENSILPCAMWKGNAGRAKFKIENGIEVLATGFIEVYTPNGKYQFIVEKMIPAGKGELQLAFEQMVKRLESQGLFDAAHKKPLPAYPMRIGILTSETGAAVQDIKKSIHDRWPCAKLFLYPVPVQGEGAAEQIAAAIKDVNARNKQINLELLIVGRGGGSIEDLWAFNEEVLAKAIYNSKIPIISAVGHEYDTTIADLVADARASTPTKAGVVAVPDREEVLAELSHLQKRINNKIYGKLQLAEETLQTVLASAVFRNPLLSIRHREQRLDEFVFRITETVKELIAIAKNRLAAMGEKILKIEPHRLIGRKTMELNIMQSRAEIATKNVLNRLRLVLTANENRLAVMNPKSVLGRGYSITTLQRTGGVVTKTEDVQIGDAIITELAKENLIESKVTKK